ncbi:MAG: TolC family outer membrane protein [Gammaproteobacteria bacterium]|nr:TolC family outer membrane protein [Gammaproteobacteria bacterium]
MTFSRLCAYALFAFLISPAWSSDLLEVYKLALQSDPLLREADANRLAAMEIRPQARSLLMPSVALTASETDQGQDGLSSQFGQTGFVDTFSDSDSDQTSYGVSLIQPVFRWDSWLLLKQADKVVARSEIDYEVVKQAMMLRVVARYFDVLAAQDELESSEASKEAIKRQLEQAETRFEVGLIAITGVQEARAAYDTEVASEILARRVLATARESLREITGVYVDKLEEPGSSLPLMAPEPADDEAWVNIALNQNLQLNASRIGVQIAKESIKVQKAGRLPTLDLVVQRNEFEADTRQSLTFPPVAGSIDSPTRSDFTTDVVLLQLNLPIYTGGFRTSKVREAVYEHRAARERLERIARNTERQTRDAYLGVISDISIVRALERALESTETALKATEAGFEVGTRTTVDVLDARRELFTARTNLERGRYDYIINLLNLKQAAGTLTDADLVEINDWLN